MRHRPVPSLLSIALGLCGCGEVTGLPSAEPVPILQGLLLLGDSQHLLQAEWSSPTQIPFEPTQRAVDPSLVDLWLVGRTGDSTPYATTGLPGQFAVIATVRGGERYRLSGTVAGREVTAQVNVPGALVVAQPAGDTLRFPLAADFPEIPFAWRAESAISYQALLVRDDGTTRTALVVRERDSTGLLLDIAPDATGRLLFLSPSPRVSDTARLVILGYDQSATAFFSSTTKGNIRGAFGLFGAAAKAEKVVVWE